MEYDEIYGQHQNEIYQWEEWLLLWVDGQVLPDYGLTKTKREMV